MRRAGYGVLLILGLSLEQDFCIDVINYVYDVWRISYISHPHVLGQTCLFD